MKKIKEKLLFIPYRPVKFLCISRAKQWNLKYSYFQIIIFGSIFSNNIYKQQNA